MVSYPVSVQSSFNTSDTNDQAAANPLFQIRAIKQADTSGRLDPGDVKFSGVTD